MIKHIREYKKKVLKRTLHDDPDAACRAYLLFNWWRPRTLVNYRPMLIRRAADFGYMHWPSKIAGLVKDRDVLDIGCGMGLHAIGFIAVGAKSYAGIDTKLKLNKDRVKNLRKGKKEHFGWTPRQIMRLIPRITVVRGTIQDIRPKKKFDLAVLHNVTEHLMNIEEVFKGVWERLRFNGLIVYNHHNFYCWNGHHQRPKFTDQIDPNDSTQKNFIDWAHLTFNPPPDHEIAKSINRIRLDELKNLTEKYYRIDSWIEHPSDNKRGAGRLTDEIRRQNPRYTERELTTQGVLCEARKRDQPLLSL